MKHIDLLIENDQIAVDADGLPLMVADRASIAQDIIHAIRESGYLVRMVADRSAEMRQLMVQKITRLVEADERIVPGTVVMESVGIDGTYLLAARTVEYGGITLELSA